MNHLKISILVPLLLILAACGTMMVFQQSLDERLSTAYDQHTGALLAVAAATDAGDLSSAQNAHAIELADNAKFFLDAARTATNPADAENQAILAANVLRALQTYLRKEQK